MTRQITAPIIASIVLTTIAVIAGILLDGWMCQLVVLCAVWTELAIVGEMCQSTREPDIYRINVRLPAMLTIVLFVFGLTQ